MSAPSGNWSHIAVPSRRKSGDSSDGRRTHARAHAGQGFECIRRRLSPRVHAKTQSDRWVPILADARIRQSKCDRLFDRRAVLQGNVSGRFCAARSCPRRLEREGSEREVGRAAATSSLGRSGPASAENSQTVVVQARRQRLGDFLLLCCRAHQRRLLLRPRFALAA